MDMKLRTFLSITAVVAVIFGGMFLFLPNQSLEGFGMVVTDGAISLARAVGILLIGLGLINWMARGEKFTSPALQGILWANLLIQVVSIILDYIDITSGVVNAGGWAGEAVHVVFAAGFAYFLFKQTS